MLRAIVTSTASQNCRGLRLQRGAIGNRIEASLWNFVETSWQPRSERSRRTKMYNFRPRILLPNFILWGLLPEKRVHLKFFNQKKWYQSTDPAQTQLSTLKSPIFPDLACGLGSAAWDRQPDSEFFLIFLNLLGKGFQDWIELQDAILRPSTVQEIKVSG